VLKDGKKYFFPENFSYFLLNFLTAEFSLWKVAVLATKPKKSLSELLGGRKENFAEKRCYVMGKHVMKSLKHNGIYVPPYDLKGFSIRIQDQQIKLTQKTEPMAMAWSRRVLSTTIPPPDKVFTKNFMKEFLEQLKKENSQASFLTVSYQNTCIASIIHQQPKTMAANKLTKLTSAKLNAS
jgi:hypothetical protein